MFRNFHNSLNSLEYQYSVHNSLLHLHSNFQDAITQQNIANKRTLTHFIFAMNVRNNYACYYTTANKRTEIFNVQLTPPTTGLYWTRPKQTGGCQSVENRKITGSSGYGNRAARSALAGRTAILLYCRAGLFLPKNQTV